MLKFLNKLAFDPQNFQSVLAACMAGNHAAQQQLYKKYFGYSKSICLRYAFSTEEADDILNEGFLKVFNHLERYDPEQPFKAWLRTIMVNTAISHYRKHKKHHEERSSFDDIPEQAVSEDIVGEITAAEILGLVHQLKPMYKTVFLLHAVDGYNHGEIAELLQLNEATVRSQYARARIRLQSLIAHHFPDLVPVWQAGAALD